jgi:hypothetical protein
LAGGGLFVLGVVLIASLVGISWWVKNSKPKLDAESNCPSTGPVAVHAIMVDQSDPISGQQAQQVREFLGQVTKSAAFGTRFDFYTFEGNTSDELIPILRICAPGKPEEANELIENPERIRKRYEERFAAVIDTAVNRLLHASTLPTSPIIESIRAASITSFAGADVDKVALRLTLISDMIQHSAGFSQFRSDAGFDRLSNSAAWVGLRPALRGAETRILYLWRPTALRNGKQVQNRGHQAFWEQLISASGGRLQGIQPL